MMKYSIMWIKIVLKVARGSLQDVLTKNAPDPAKKEHNKNKKTANCQTKISF